MPYEAARPRPASSPEELRARVPGWGLDAAPQHRRTAGEWPEPQPAPARWSSEDRQPDDPRRERSVEHRMLPPVYGTAQPLHGLSGAIRRLAYDRMSETRNTRWLLLIVGDRVEAVGAHWRSLLTRRPDDPITQTGILSEPRHRPLRSRFGRGRLDVRHTWMDPFVVLGPWVASVTAVVLLMRRLRRPDDRRGGRR